MNPSAQYRFVPLFAALFVAANLALWATYFVSSQKGHLPGMLSVSVILCLISLFVIIPYGALKGLDSLGRTIVCFNIIICAAIYLV